MSLKTLIARWLDPDAYRTVERYHYLRARLSEAQQWLGYDFPEVDATIMWAKVSEVNHFRRLDQDAVETVPGKPWIWTVYDFREHLRSAHRAKPVQASQPKTEEG